MFIKDIAKQLELHKPPQVGARDQETTLRGWVFNLRSSGKICFLQFRDGTGMIQAIVEKSGVSDEVWQAAKSLTIESSVELTGVVAKDDRSPYGYEMRVKDLKVVQIAEEFPIGKKEHGPDFLLDHRHLWLRSPRQWAIQKIRNTIINATYQFFNQEGFTKIDTPILTPNACEGTTTLFEVPYFDDDKAYLAQSGQLYLEAAIMSFGRCFDFGPVFRAEKSKTRRHLTEFWMMDAEAAFVEHDENLKIQEELISFVVAEVLKVNQSDLKILERDLGPLEKIKPPFIRKTHAEVIKELREAGSSIKNDDDLGGDDETKISEKYDRPIFIEKYPAKVKAFYMKRDSENPDLALCADLLAPEGFGEIIGGSQREDDHDALLKRVREHKLPEKDFQWYLDLRKFGSAPHSGFGYGLERLVGWICGVRHIRETIPFPRLINRLRP